MVTSAVPVKGGAARPMTRRREESHLRVEPRNSLRVVRLLSVRLARRDHREALLHRPRPDGGVHRRADGLRRGLPRPAVRGARVRPARRHDRSQVHLPGDDPDHGPVDVHRRPAAHLRLDRHRRADHPRRPAPASGPGPRRRVRRRSDLRRRARAARQARRVHVVDPDDGHARPVPLADRHHRLQGDPRRRGVRRVGLARSVPAVVPAADHLGLDPAAA